MSEHEEWVCPHCGTRNSDQFCENCGAPRPAASQPAPAEERVSDETQVLPGMPAVEGNPSVGGPDSAGPEAVPQRQLVEAALVAQIVQRAAPHFGADPHPDCRHHRQHRRRIVP